MRKDTPPSLRGERRSTWQSISFQHHRLLRPKLFCARNDKQCGNALWFILVAIGLLGLLTVMLSRSGSSTNETGSYEQNVIAANQILSYAKNIENGVQNLLARGCSENEISFEDSIIANHANSNAPADKSCHVFDVAGAGLTALAITDFWPNGDWTGGTAYNHFVGRQDLDGIGTNGEAHSEDLYWFIELPQNINEENFCSAYNKISTGDSTVPLSRVWASPRFDGNFVDAPFSAQPEIRDKNSICFQNDIDTNRYQFYHVLHAR